MTASVVTRSCDKHSGVGHDVKCTKIDSRSEAMADCHSFDLTIGYENWNRKVVMDETAAGRSVLL
jgi:hypothetical protein